MTTLHKIKETGQGLVEYALILVLVAVAAIVTLSLLGTSIGDIYFCMIHEIGAETQALDGVHKYVLIDATTDQEVERAQCGQAISLSEGINFRAYTSGDVASIEFAITLPDGTVLDRSEGTSPWAVFGDISGDYNEALGGTLDSGRYEIFAETDRGETSKFIFFVE